MKTKNYSELFEVKLNNGNIYRAQLFNPDKKTFESLIQYLQENNITRINLIDNNIGTEGAKFLAEALKENSTLTSINLWSDYCNIETELEKLIKERLEENKVCEVISKFNNFDQFKIVNIKANKLLAKKIADTLMSITSEDLQKFYQENNIDDQSFDSYQQFLMKNTNESESINQAFQQYHNITDDFVSFLTITGFTKHNCGNLDFYQQMKFYECLAHSPIKIIFACFQNYTLEEATNNPLLIPALHKICQQLEKHQTNTAFMELIAEVPLFNSIINSEIVFESLGQNEKEEGHISLFEDSNQGDDLQVNNIGEIHEN